MAALAAGAQVSHEDRDGSAELLTPWFAQIESTFVQDTLGNVNHPCFIF